MATISNLFDEMDSRRLLLPAALNSQSQSLSIMAAITTSVFQRDKIVTSKYMPVFVGSEDYYDANDDGSIDSSF